MKTVILLFTIAISVNADGQKLKDLLYSGKLKSDSGSVVRQTDDRKMIIDTSTKKNTDSTKTKPASSITDPTVKEVNIQIETDISTGDDKKNNIEPVKDNNKLWKEFMDEFVNTFSIEILSNKKIKSGIYYILVDYEIGLDGQVTINNVYPSPENKFLQEQIKEKLTSAAPKLNPVLLSTGKPRKVLKKYNFTLTKS